MKPHLRIMKDLHFTECMFYDDMDFFLDVEKLRTTPPLFRAYEQVRKLLHSLKLILMISLFMAFKINSLTFL